MTDDVRGVGGSVRIACLGWGSLIWSPRMLPLMSDWSHDGPSLPIEFARQSGDGRITLVVTPGTKATKVFSAVLNVSSVEEACRVLAEREGIPSKFVVRSVGHWAASSHSHHPEAEAIGEWAGRAGYSGVVWTALEPKFGEAYNTPTCERVIAYLAELSGATRERAENYVRRTPKVIRTAYRAAIEQVLGWTPVADAQ